jgi:hypothetical protein
VVGGGGCCFSCCCCCCCYCYLLRAVPPPPPRQAVHIEQARPAPVEQLLHLRARQLVRHRSLERVALLPLDVEGGVTAAVEILLEAAGCPHLPALSLCLIERRGRGHAHVAKVAQGEAYSFSMQVDIAVLLEVKPDHRNFRGIVTLNFLEPAHGEKQVFQRISRILF